jgi:hypothetical protein
VVVGQSASANGDVNHSRGTTDYWIIKLDSLGNFIWKNSYGGTGKDEAYAVDACSDGGFIVAGGSRSKNLDVTNNHGAYDFWMVKLKSNGNLDWQKSFGVPDIDEAYDVKQTSDGGYIAVGYAKSKTGDVTSQKGKGDYWIVKWMHRETCNGKKVTGALNLTLHMPSRSLRMAATSFRAMPGRAMVMLMVIMVKKIYG